MILILLFLLAFLLVAGLVSIIIYKTRPIVFASFSAITSTIQIYTIPIAGIYFSLSFISGLFSVKAILNKSSFRFSWMKFLIFFELARAISIFWSPVPVEGIRYIIYEMLFVFIFCAFSNEDKKTKKVKELSLILGLMAVSINAVLVILFRIFPELESLFLHSGLASILISENTLRSLLTNEPSNVLDPLKAGGVFVNANIAAVHLGVSSFLAITFGKVLQSRYLFLLGCFYWVAVFFAGSKASIMIALALPILIYFIGNFYTNNITLKHVVFIFWFLIFSILALGLVYYFLKDSRFAENSQSTLESRIAIWEFARISFLKSPLQGLGFGGWSQEFAAYAYLNGIRADFPAHNSYLVLWAQSGMLALILGICFTVSLIKNLLQALKFNNSASERLLLKGMLGAFLWMTMQSLGENYPVIGEIHIAPLLAMVLGYAASIGILDGSPQKTRMNRKGSTT